MPGLNHIQYGDHYPLVDPPEELRGVVAGLVLTYSDPVWEYDLPLHLTALTESRVVIRSESGRIVLDADDIQTSVSHGRTMYQWRSDRTELTLFTNRTVNIPETDGVIDLRAVFCTPPHIRTINGIPGTLELEEGYNTALQTSADTGIRQGVSVTLSAVAGAGAGIVPADCPEEEKLPGLKTINGVRPDENGVFYLQTANGHAVRTSCHALQIYNTNAPCCTCEDMANLGDYLQKVGDQYRLIGGKLKWLRDKQNALVKHLEETPIQSAAEAINLQLLYSSCPYFEVRLAITNISQKCYTSLKAIYKFQPEEAECLKQVISKKETSTGPFVAWQRKYYPAEEGDGEYRMEEVQGENSCKVNTVFVDHTSTDQSAKWSMVSPGETVYWHGLFRLKPADDSGAFSDPQPIEVRLHSVQANIGTGGHPEYIYRENCGDPGCGTDHPLHLHSYLTGTIVRKLEMDCGERDYEDPVPDKEGAEALRRDVFEIKKELWPCEEEGV